MLVRGGCLDNPGVFEYLVSTKLIDILDGASRDAEAEGLARLRDEHALVLQVSLARFLAAGVKLRCTGAVAVLAANLRTLAGYCTYSTHSGAIVPQWYTLRN